MHELHTAMKTAPIKANTLIKNTISRKRKKNRSHEFCVYIAVYLAVEKEHNCVVF